MELSTILKEFIETEKWTYAKTMPKWKHEYIVQERVDHKLFVELAEFIDTYGYEEYFYKRKQPYYDYGKYTYWHMGNIINRCLKEDTYAKRRDRGELPD